MPLKPTLRENLITVLIGIIFFIALPVLVTVMLPVTWVTLERSADNKVSATAYTCVLFVLPWRVQQVAEVTGIESNTIRGDRIVRQNSYGKNRGYVHSDGVDALILFGELEALTVAVSPASTAAVEAKGLAFLQDQSQRKTRIFVIPNWKFGLGMGLPLTLLAWLYIIGSLLAGLRALYRRFHRLKPA